MTSHAMTPARRLVPPLLRDLTFRRYWGASTISMFGDQVSSIAVPLAGVLADRRGRRRHTMIL
jgi:nitrate/nitrite transporter NarK